MYVHWLDEIKEFCFNVTHLPGSQNPTDQLSRRGVGDCDGQAGSTGEQYQESQQELFSRLGRNAPCTAELAVVRAGWAETCRIASVWFAGVQEGDEIPSTRPKGGKVSPQCTGPGMGTGS